MNNITKILETNAGIFLNSKNDNNEKYQLFVMKNTRKLRESIGTDIDGIINHQNFKNNFSLNYLIDELIKNNQNTIAEDLISKNYDKIPVDSFNRLTMSAIESNDYDIDFVKRLLSDDKIRKYFLEMSVTGNCVSKSKTDIIKEFSKISNFYLLGRDNCNLIGAIVGDKPEIVKTMLEYNKNKFKENSNRLFKCALNNSSLETIKYLINDENINLKKYQNQDSVLFSFKENSDKGKIEYLFNHKKFLKAFELKNIKARFSVEDAEVFRVNKNKLNKKIGIKQ